MEPWTTAEVANFIGLSCDFIAGFLLTVETLRISRIAKAADTLKALIDSITESKVFADPPLPLKWRFALPLIAISITIWVLAPALTIFTLTPTLYFGVFLLYRFLYFSIHLSQTGTIAVIGFTLFSVGYALQLVAVLLAHSAV